MSENPYRPTVHTQAELERVWRHLMEPLGFGGHSLWLMCIEPGGRVLPRLTQIEDAVRPPTDEEAASFADFLRHLRDRLPSAERIVFLRSRPGLGGPRPDDLAWARSLYATCRAAGVETDVVHLATDDTLVPLPMDAALAEPA
jgi:hypothetical protein